MTHSQLRRDIYSSNRFKKVQERTAFHLQKSLDKKNVQAVIKSLRHANREILKHNKIKEKLDDFLTL